MIRRAYMIGVLVAMLTASAVRTTPVYQKLMSSAANFQQYCHDLKSAGNSLNPIERIVFSLVLTNANPQPEHPAAVAGPRT